MCHSEVPEGSFDPGDANSEVVIPLADGAGMPAYLASPAAGSGAGVLVIPDMFGRSPFYENLARRLASLGFVALCPEPFHRVDPLAERDFDLALERRRQTDEVGMLADVDAAADWLSSLPDVVGPNIGVIGFCMGGTFVLNLAALRDDTAGCCFYGFPSGSVAPSTSAPRPLDVVEEISGPLVGFWGDKDAAVSMDDVRLFGDRLEARGVDYRYTIYPGADHGFVFTGAEGDGPNGDAATDAWARATDFLATHL